jgi:hypothetical protein
MTGIEFIGPSGGNASPEFEALRASVGAPPPWFDTSALSGHLSQAMWFPALFFSSQQHLNAQSGRPFSLWAYYADDLDVIAYCVADEDRHLATIGAPFVWRLVKICDLLGEALSRRPRIGVATAEQPKLSHDPEFAALLAGDIAVSRDEAVAIAARWPEPEREGQQLELGPYALFHDLVRLIWVHEWAHALTGHVSFASRDLQLMALPEFSAERSQLQSASADRPPAHEVFQAIELHADEFAVRYCAQQILWGYDPIGRVAGPRVDLVDRPDLVGAGDATGARDLGEPRAQAGVAALHAGLAEVAVVQHHDRQVPGLLGADGGQAADAHQLFTVTGDDHHRLLRLRQCQAQADRSCAAHGAPQVIVAVAVAGCKHVVGGRAQTRDHQRVGRGGQQAGDEGAAINVLRSCVVSHQLRSHFLRPIRL